MINTIYLGADHGGYDLKESIKKHLAKSPGYKVIDLGTTSTASVDYPEYGKAVGEKVAKDPESVGIVVCGSGVGISIAANKVKGVRAALCNSLEVAELARQHNGANVLAMGARTKNYDDPLQIVEAFLNAPMDPADRHKRRRDQLDKLGN